MKNKVIIGGIVATVISANVMMYQGRVIQGLEEEISLRQEIAEQEFDFVKMEAIKKSIEERLNDKGTIKVLDGNIYFNHTYVLSEKGAFGLTKEEKIVGKAKCYFEWDIDLTNAKVNTVGNKIVIELGEVYLNEDSVHRVHNTFVLNDKESSSNIWSNKTTARRAMRYWEDTFDKMSKEKIIDLYNQEELRDKSVEVLTDIVGTFVTDDIVIEVR